MKPNQILSVRHAKSEDINAIVRLLSDDPLGAKREKFESPLPTRYLDAFRSIDNDPNNDLIVTTFAEKIVGCMQITYIPYLTYQGGWRALIEGVRVDRTYRNQGIGKRMFEWAIESASAKGCHLVQLTTDKKRPDALKFYESLGFQATHEGMKLHLRD